MLALASTVPTLLLVLVLIISGVAKLRNAASVRESFITLQLPPGLTRSPAPAVLPWGEIVLAVALVVLWGPLAIAAAAATLALFVAYLVVIARASRFDHRVECGCLGRLGLGVVGPVTVVRNVVLVALAGWVLVDALDGRSVLSRWLAAEAEGWIWLALVALAVVLAGLMVHAGQDPDSASGAGAGQPAGAGNKAGQPPLGAGDAASQPPVSAGDGAGQPPVGAGDGAGHLVPLAEGELLTGEADYERTPIPHVSLVIPNSDQRVHLRHLAVSQARLLVFINPGCGACVTALKAVPALRAKVGELLGIHLVFARPTDADNPYVAPEALGDEWFVDPEGIFTVTLQLASPGAVLLGADGYLAGGPVVGAQSVIEFFDDIADALTGDDTEAALA